MPEIVWISFAEGEKGNVLVTTLGANTHRLEWTIIPIVPTPELYWGDVIETTAQADGTLRFLRIVSRGSFRHSMFLLSQAFLDSAEFTTFCNAVDNAGGKWERVMGGLVFVHIPDSSSFNAEVELERHMASLERQTRSRKSAKDTLIDFVQRSARRPRRPPGR